MLDARERAGADLLGEAAERVRRVPAELGVALDEAHLRLGREAEHVVVDEDLGVAGRPGADPDRRDLEPLGDLAGDLGRYALEHDREDARVLERERRVGDRARREDVAALDAVAAELGDGLGREADVAHDGDTGPHDRVDGVPHVLAALELHAVGAALLEEPSGVPDRLLDRDLVAEEGHVADDEAALPRADDRLAVVDHLVERHGQGRLVPEEDVRERVADEDDLDSGFVHGPRLNEVVGGDHGEALPLPLHVAEHGDRDALGRTLGR